MIEKLRVWKCPILSPPKETGYYLVKHKKDWDVDYRISCMAYINFGTEEKPVLHWNKGRYWYSSRIVGWSHVQNYPCRAPQNRII